MTTASPGNHHVDGRVGVAVVGLGYWGPSLVRNLLTVEQCDLLGVVDQDPRRIESVCRCWPGVPARTWDAVLADENVDAIVVATPAVTHYDLASEALDHHKDVLVEKPLALEVNQASELADRAQREGRILAVGHTYVYQPAVRLMRRLTVDGEAGTPLYIDSVRANLGIFRSDTNVLFDLAAHDVSILDYMLDQMPTSIRCSAFRVVSGQHESLAYLLLTYESGVVAHLQVNWLSPRKLRQITVGCDSKMIVYDDTSALEKVKVYDSGVVEPRGMLVDGNDDAVRHRRVEVRAGDIWAPHLDSEEPLRTQCRDFVDSVRNRTQPLSDGALGVRVVRVLDAAQRSASRGGDEVPITRVMAGK